MTNQPNPTQPAQPNPTQPNQTNTTSSPSIFKKNSPKTLSTIRRFHFPKNSLSPVTKHRN
uniref:Uncharacterized protein n=1 Tax=Salix viminalis TaxID=40686 RepID=A0A6N2N100_SALVM